MSSTSQRQLLSRRSRLKKKTHDAVQPLTVLQGTLAQRRDAASVVTNRILFAAAVERRGTRFGRTFGEPIDTRYTRLGLGRRRLERDLWRIPEDRPPEACYR